MSGERTPLSISRPRAVELPVPGAWTRRGGAARVLARAWTAYLAGWSLLVRSGYAPPGAPHPRPDPAPEGEP